MGVFLSVELNAGYVDKKQNKNKTADREHTRASWDVTAVNGIWDSAAAETLSKV